MVTRKRTPLLCGLVLLYLVLAVVPEPAEAWSWPWRWRWPFGKRWRHVESSKRKPGRVSSEQSNRPMEQTWRDSSSSSLAQNSSPSAPANSPANSSASSNENSPATSEGAASSVARQSPDSALGQDSSASANSDALASALGASAAIASASPNMLGDQFARPVVALNAPVIDQTSNASASTLTGSAGTPSPTELVVTDPVTREVIGFVKSSMSADQERLRVLHRVRARTKIADNNNVLPTSRFFYSYNGFANVFETDADLHRQTFGLEQAFFDQRASVEVRAALNTLSGDGLLGGSEIGHTNLTFKALLLRAETWLVSVGTGLALPFGPVPDGSPGGNAIVSPFLGYAFGSRENLFFVQAFTQVDLPAASEDQGLLHTDIGVGAWLRRDATDQWIHSFAPTVELHAYTPLGASPSGSLTSVIYRDVLNLTLGGTMWLGRASIALAVSIPLLEGMDYDLEGQLHLNFTR